MKKKTALVKNAALPVIVAGLSSLNAPIEIKLSCLALQAAYGFFTDIYPDESKEFYNRLNKAIPDLKAQIVESKELQLAITLTYESLVSARLSKKRALIEAVFFDGYISTSERHRVYIERFYRVSHEISIDALEHLYFIKHEILPRKERVVREKVAAMDKKNRKGTDEWWYDLEYTRMADAEIIQQWVYEEYNLHSKKVKVDETNPNIEQEKWQKWATLHGDKERAIENKFSEFTSELTSLGIMKPLSTYDGRLHTFNGSLHTLTEFGREFLKFINVMGVEEGHK